MKPHRKSDKALDQKEAKNICMGVDYSSGQDFTRYGLYIGGKFIGIVKMYE